MLNVEAGIKAAWFGPIGSKVAWLESAADFEVNILIFRNKNLHLGYSATNFKIRII